MTNSKKAIPEVTISLAGKPYKCRFGMKAIILLDKEFGINMFEQNNVDMNTPTGIAKFMWAGLQKHHPELSFDLVVELLDESDMDELQNSMQKFLNNSLTDDVKKASKKKGEARIN